MALQKDFVPILPFPDFKWRWATLAPTEGLNDPVVYLGILFRMRKLESAGLRYSSPEFAHEMQTLARDIGASVTGINIAGRTRDRNLIRNSQQYWKALDLISSENTNGRIVLSDLGHKVADREISQTEFAAITIRTLTLPNPRIQTAEECKRWYASGIRIQPLLIVLSTICELHERSPEDGYLTPMELMQIIVPLSATAGVTAEDYANFVMWHRSGELDLAGWPSTLTRSNDSRFVKEFLIFLHNYGYLTCDETSLRNKRYFYNAVIDDEIQEIIDLKKEPDYLKALEEIRTSDVASDIERKRVQFSRTYRPNQAKFRKAILQAFDRCVITNVGMPEVLEAAHIRPVKYQGEDTVANGLAMRMDIHLLFDAGHLRIEENGTVHLSSRARMEYGASIPPRIYLPDVTSRDFIRWRWNNYNGM